MQIYEKQQYSILFFEKKAHFDGNFCGILTVTFAVFWR